MAKGCSQMLRCSFRETFSLVVKLATIRTILSIIVSMKWPQRQVDVNNAFLNGEITEEVYMQQPSRYVQFDADGRPLVCRLTKALYGLRQALRAWFEKLKSFLVSVGFVGPSLVRRYSFALLIQLVCLFLFMLLTLLL